MVSGFQSEGQKVKCMYCQGELKKGIAPFHVDRKNLHMVLDAVPAWVCEQCGEIYLDENEAEAIQDLVKTVEEKTQALAITA